MEKRDQRTAHAGSRSCSARANRRRGAVLLFALVCLLLLSLLGASLMKLASAQGRQIRRDQMRVQAVWLAEAGIERAAAQLAADAEYTGETWELPAEEIGGAGPAVVRIEIQADANDQRRRTIAVAADYPADTEQRARVSKQVEVRGRGLGVGD